MSQQSRNQQHLTQLISCAMCFLSEVIDLIKSTQIAKNTVQHVNVSCAKKGYINKQKYYHLIRMKTHTIHRSIDLEDTLTLQVTRPAKKKILLAYDNLHCI